MYMYMEGYFRVHLILNQYMLNQILLLVLSTDSFRRLFRASSMFSMFFVFFGDGPLDLSLVIVCFILLC